MTNSKLGCPRCQTGVKHDYYYESYAPSIFKEMLSGFSLVEKLKTGAFNTGSSIGDVLLVGGIYLRDIIFGDLGFKIDDLDKPKG